MLSVCLVCVCVCVCVCKDSAIMYRNLEQFDKALAMVDEGVKLL